MSEYRIGVDVAKPGSVDGSCLAIYDAERGEYTEFVFVASGDLGEVTIGDPRSARELREREQQLELILWQRLLDENPLPDDPDVVPAELVLDWDAYAD
jgi:hypothetical protein